ncbi:Hypothetical protein CINCED_3A018037 [Cinara cedri]|uniref:Uncharacterized protein n=1 Tax=Cinara cedri TaxID=506608 RepID=A0A5E4MB02_9HEMI|nr:Hypothetical protein CINCED_3A018037 [Cinara cedri]
MLNFAVWLTLILAVCIATDVEAGPILQQIAKDNNIKSGMSNNISEADTSTFPIVQDNRITSELTDIVAEPMSILQQNATGKSSDFNVLLKRINMNNEEFSKKFPNGITDYYSYLDTVRRAFTEYRLTHRETTSEPNFYNYGW